MNLRLPMTVSNRRALLEKEQAVHLVSIGSSALDDTIASLHNCENMIGFTQVPLGVAGPLLVHSAQGDTLGNKNEVYIPLATTEGALVASIARGCKAITQSGGAKVKTNRVGTTRGPVFCCQDDTFGEWLNTHLPELSTVAGKTSKHTRLLSLQSSHVGSYWYVRFCFDTQDAMGMNMVTIATQALVDHITKHTNATCIALAGNFDTDKKASWLNIVEGRGIQSWASVQISEKILTEVLKTDAKSFHAVWLAKCLLGSAISGSQGYNCHFANALSALFLATGQDIAHIAECSVGITTVELTDAQEVAVSVYLPDLLVGTVGGGTHLPTQKEALTLLAIAGGDEGKNALRFAEIAAATVLAGEISLLASLSEGSLASAHEKLARGK